MDETKAARCGGDVRKLTHFFETLGTSSPGTAKSRGLVAGGGERQSASCELCFKVHPSLCPWIDRPCHVCYKVHRSFLCPYLDHFPRGAEFNPGYAIYCVCGNVFNEDKWACTFCGRNWPVLRKKYCSICKVYGQHRAHECPKDEVLAAHYKSIRDEMLSKVLVPLYSPSCEDEGSIYIPEATYSPTAPSWVCEDMKMNTPCWTETSRTI